MGGSLQGDGKAEESEVGTLVRFEHWVTLCLTPGRTPAVGSSFPGWDIKVAETSAPLTREQNWPSTSQGPEEPACIMLGTQHGETVTTATPFLRPARQKVLVIDVHLPSFPLRGSDDLRVVGLRTSHPGVLSRWPALQSLGTCPQGLCCRLGHPEPVPRRLPATGVWSAVMPSVPTRQA